MKLIALSAGAWVENPGACISIINRLLRIENYMMVTLDMDSVRTQGHTVPSELAFTRQPLIDWLRPQTEDYRVDVVAMRNAVLQMDLRQPVLLDASGFSLEVVTSVLDAARQTWYPLASWPPAFVLVCEDALLLPLSERLLSSFYLSPRGISPREMLAIARKIERRASTARWFGLNPLITNTASFIRDQWIRLSGQRIGRSVGK